MRGSHVHDVRAVAVMCVAVVHDTPQVRGSHVHDVRAVAVMCVAVVHDTPQVRGSHVHDVRAVAVMCVALVHDTPQVRGSHVHDVRDVTVMCVAIVHGRPQVRGNSRKHRSLSLQKRIHTSPAQAAYLTLRAADMAERDHVLLSISSAETGQVWPQAMGCHT